MMSFSAQGMVPIINAHGEDLIGVEIGVDKGKTTRGLIDSCPNIKKLYAVDPWLAYDDGKTRVDQKEQDIRMVLARENVSQAIRSDAAEIILKGSVEFSLEVDNDSMDFVYIDGDHSYQAVTDDLLFWYPKIKKGGIISGHDFRPGKDHEVKRAVYDFALANGYEIKIIEDGWSWYFIK